MSLSGLFEEEIVVVVMVVTKLHSLAEHLQFAKHFAKCFMFFFPLILHHSSV